MKRKKYSKRLPVLAILLVVALVSTELPVNGMAVWADISAGEDGVITERSARTVSGQPATGAAVTPSTAPSLPVLKRVSGVKVVRYSTHAVRLTWKKHKKAKYYRVYVAKKTSGTRHFRLAGVTKKRHMLVKGLKNKRKYLFYVQACRKRKRSASDSRPSKLVHIKMKKYSRKTVFAGDSICEGIGMGWSFPQMHISGRKKTVAYRGLNTVTFRTKRLFHGKSGLRKLIAEKPYRVYMMLGLNEVFYRKSGDILKEYKGLIRDIRYASPDTDIVLCALSPVTRAERARHVGMKHIPSFNRKLKKMAGKMGLTYLDYTAFLKDSQGYLKAGYAAADGYHWKPSAYVKFGKVVGKFDRSLDR